MQTKKNRIAHLQYLYFEIEIHADSPKDNKCTITSMRYFKKNNSLVSLSYSKRKYELYIKLSDNETPEDATNVFPQSSVRTEYNIMVPAEGYVLTSKVKEEVKRIFRKLVIEERRKFEALQTESKCFVEDFLRETK